MSTPGRSKKSTGGFLFSSPCYSGDPTSDGCGRDPESNPNDGSGDPLFKKSHSSFLLCFSVFDFDFHNFNLDPVPQDSNPLPGGYRHRVPRRVLFDPLKVECADLRACTVVKTERPHPHAEAPYLPSNPIPLSS